MIVRKDIWPYIGIFAAALIGVWYIFATVPAKAAAAYLEGRYGYDHALAVHLATNP